MYISKKIRKQNTSEEEGFFELNGLPELPKILIMGVGGAGNNCINHFNLNDYPGITTIAVNTDSQQLNLVDSDIKVLIGTDLTRGLGAGGDPALGKAAAKASTFPLERLFDDVELVFLIAGMGGGTGTGAAPVIAKIAREKDVIVVGIATTPFRFERGRKRRAEQGLRNLSNIAHSMLVIDNNKLLKIVPNSPLDGAFENINNLIAEIISGLTETMTSPSLINLDFADIKTIMSNGNLAMMYYGESSTLDANEIVKNALNNPLLDSDYTQANGALIHITGGENLSLELTADITKNITKRLKPKANVIMGARINPSFDKEVRLLTIMTGFKSYDDESQQISFNHYPYQMNQI
jgi:cell division protein FtsZ